MKKSIFYALVFLFWANTIKAQIPKEQTSVPSPQAWNFTQYGNIPVSYFTGLPNISIPLETLESGEYKMPISLSYNAGGVRPDIHPGATGLGWSLSLGGVVTRRVRGIPDELSFTRNIPASGGPIGGVYPTGWMWYNNVYDFSSDFTKENIVKGTPEFVCSGASGPCPQTGFPDNHWIPYYGDGTTNMPLDGVHYSLRDASNQPVGQMGKLDVLKDEFEFNVNGLSGKFYLSKGDWNNITDIQCNRKVKISIMGGLIDVPSELHPVPPSPSNGIGYSGPQEIVSNTTPWWQSNAFPKTFGSFMITDEDGTQYVFGKNVSTVNGYNAIEYSMSFFDRQEPWTPDAWYLSSIYTPDQKSIYFKYDRGARNFNNLAAFQASLYASSFDYALGNVNLSTPSSVGGRLTYPTYLTSVKSDIADIDLSYSNSTQLTYSTTSYLYSPGTGALYNPVYNTYINMYSSTIAWQKLDNINISIQGKPKVNYSLTYNNIATERLFLKKLSKQINNTFSAEHSFEYDNSLALPQYLANQTDHWGFWNGTSNSCTAQNYYSCKQPNATYLYPGVLNKINYPTGGNTQFIYEPNDYGKYVNSIRTQGTANAGSNIMAGGLRIKQIKSYDPVAQVPYSQKQYYYKSGYNGALTEPQIAALNSSGVLNSQIQYYWNDQISYWDIYTGWTLAQFSVFSTQSIAPVYDNYHIGYSEVAERLSDGSYSVYKFSNHDNGYTDDNYTNSLSAYVNSPYTKYSDNNFKRGLLLEKRDFNNSNILLANKTITYKANDASLPYFADWEFNYFNNTSLTANYAKTALFGSVYKVYKYAFVPDVETDITYDQTGTNPLTVQKQSFYENPLHGQLTKSVTTDSKGNELTTILKYAQDYPSDFMLNNITNSRPGTVLEKLQLKKDPVANVQNVTGGEVYEYGLSTGGSMPWLNSVYRLETDKPFPLSGYTATTPITRSMNSTLYPKDTRYKEVMKINKYDDYYNPVDIQKSNGERNLIVRGNKNNNIIAVDKIGGAINPLYDFCIYTSFEKYNYPGFDQYNLPINISSWDNENDFIYDDPALPGSTTAFSGTNSYNGTVKIKRQLWNSNLTVLSLRGGNLPLVQAIDNNNNPTGGFAAITKIGEQGIWDVYRANVGGGIRCQVNSNGNYIDELRITSWNAINFMTTYTYKNGLVSTVTDPNLNTSYYEYDNIGRLVLIRDKDKNIIKKICYNYAGQPEDCVIGTSNIAQWRATGNSRCQVCPANSSYNSGVMEIEEKDINPGSPTYNTLHWVVDPLNHCPSPPDWVQHPELAYCEQNLNGTYTGNQVIPTYDGNPCSSSYNQQGVSVIHDYAPCHIVVCNPACNAPEYKCNTTTGTCEHGTWSIIRVVKNLSKPTTWTCYWAWCFSDGSRQGSGTTTSSTACTVTCF